MSRLFAGHWTFAVAARRASRKWRWVGGTSLVVLLLFAPLALADSAGRRAVAADPDKVGRAACQLLNFSKLPGIPHVLDMTQIGDGCEGGRCLDPRTDPDTGSLYCHYSRAALLAVGCHSNKRAATALVENLIRRHHFRRIRLNVDAAAVGMPPNGAGIPSAGTPSNTVEVAMSLGGETVGFIMHAGSDDDPNPTWPGIQHASLQGAHNLIPFWRSVRRMICPRS